MADIELMLREYGRVVDDECPPISLAELEDHLEPDHALDRRPVRHSRRGVALAAAAAAAILAVVVLVDRQDGDTETMVADQPAETEPSQVSNEALVSNGNVVPSDAAELVTSGRSVATHGTPLLDIESAVPADEGGPPLPLGTVNQLPNEDRLNFLFEHCGDGCWRDAHFMDPNNPALGSGPWPAGRPFHVRHGFVNDGNEPLGPGFDVALYVYAMDEPHESGGAVTGPMSRYTSDYVLRGEAEHCGPGYKNQTRPVTCEWFVHDFPDGLPEGRWAIWAVWEAPCSAWVGYGLTDSCANPDEVMSFFSSGVDSPFVMGEGRFYDEPNKATMTPAEIEELDAALAAEMQATEEAMGFEQLPPPGPEVEIDASGAAATAGTPLPDFAGAIVGDDGTERLPLGEVLVPAFDDRLDFLSEPCLDEGPCFRDAKFINPDDPSLSSAPWQGGRPFIVRHGFINESEEPLGDDFDVVLYVYEFDDFAAPGPARRYTSDYVLRGTTNQCGPTYRGQTDAVECEWFVHEFPEGLSTGRHALWAFWEAPCWAWAGLGFVDSCADPDEVMSLFASGVDSPWQSTPVVWDPS